MSDLPYTWTDANCDELRVTAYGVTVTYRDDEGEHSLQVLAPEGAAAVALARAALALAGDAYLITTTETWDAVNAAHAEHGARSMRERAAACADDDPTADYDIKRQILALPLLPDDGGAECKCNVIDVEGPSIECPMHGADYRALPLLPDDDTTPVCESPQELAEEIIRLRKDVEVLSADRDTAYDTGFSDGLRMGDARATDVESRLAALKKLTSDQADALEAQSQLIDALRRDMRGAQAAIRGLGEALQGHIRVNVDALKGYSREDWHEFGRQLRRRDMGEGP